MNSNINKTNVDNIHQQILKKNSSEPWHATQTDAKKVMTDYDTFPYPRWFRGEYSSSRPIVSEREAGWRRRQDSCYRLNELPLKINYPNHCFETACSTVFPCIPEYLAKYSDRDALNVSLNKACVVQYR